MGQRHQLFVVAKVAGRYRTLAAVHHQWLYGRSAVRQCLNTLNILRASASVILQDVRKAASFDWAIIENLTEQQEPVSLFPIVLTALTVGASFHHEERYASIVHPMNITITASQCDNNDGFTVFDITDPAKPRYCFLLDESSEPIDNGRNQDEEGEVRQEVLDLTLVPLSGDDYLRLYYESSEWSGMDALPLLEGLSKYSLTSSDALHHLMPGVRDRSAGESIAGAEQIADPSLNALSLREKSIVRVISQALESDPAELSWLDEAEQLPDFHHTLRGILQEDPLLVKKPSGMQLLQRSFQGKSEIDLSPFSGLTATEVVSLVTGLDESRDKTLTLTLPDLDDLRIEQVENILSRTNIAQLHFGSTRRIEIKQLPGLVANSRLKSFTHPDLYSLPFDGERLPPDALLELAPKFPSGRAAGFPLVQVLYLYGDTIFGVGPRLPNGEGVAWSRRLSDKEDQQHWSPGSATVGVVPIPLDGVLLPLDGLLRQLPVALGGLMEAPQFDMGWIGLPKIGTGIAKALALGETNRVWPIPAHLHSAYTWFGRSNLEVPPRAEALAVDCWTLLLCQESKLVNRKPQSSALRYAFASKSNDGEVVIRNVKQFLEEVVAGAGEDARTALADDFVRRFSSSMKNVFTDVSECNEAEVQEGLRTFEKHNKQVDHHNAKFADMKALWRRHH